MTEETVREVFFKNYSGGDLNEVLMATVEEISMAIIMEGVEQSESLPEIVSTVAMAKSHIILFGCLTDGARPIVSMSYLIYFDQLRKVVVDVVRYTRDNLEAMSPWFRERFKEEHLNSILAEMTFSIEKATERPVNVRTFHSSELMLYEQFLNSALIGIIGVEQFQKYAKEYNKCAVTLRQCQIEYRALGNKVITKES